MSEKEDLLIKELAKCSEWNAKHLEEISRLEAKVEMFKSRLELANEHADACYNALNDKCPGDPSFAEEQTEKHLLSNLRKKLSQAERELKMWNSQFGDSIWHMENKTMKARDIIAAALLESGGEAKNV